MSQTISKDNGSCGLVTGRLWQAYLGVDTRFLFIKDLMCGSYSKNVYKIVTVRRKVVDYRAIRCSGHWSS